MKGNRSFYVCRLSGGELRGVTQTLPAVNEIVLNFLHSQEEGILKQLLISLVCADLSKQINDRFELNNNRII